VTPEAERAEEEASLTYAAAGVDLAAADEATRRIAQLAAQARTKHVLAGVGSFGGVFELSSGKRVVASVDGVGTKLKIASATGRHDTVGEDIVNHCINDILCQGATPRFFMDYIGCGQLEPGVVEEVLSGIVRACQEAGCALLGGETAEMPGVYAPGDYDLVGFVVGEIIGTGLLDGSPARPGDAVLGMASSGLHTNGYSLAREALLGRARMELTEVVPSLGRTLADELLEPHRCYLRPIERLAEVVRPRALAHVTGGGIAGNLERVLPEGCAARLARDSWPAQPVFSLIQEAGKVNMGEMFRTFNMGLGMLAVVDPSHVPGALEALAEQGVDAYRVGQIQSGVQGVEWEGA
jgi:phosphoribosylformylglycinamidine cyclo-ligase